MNRPHTEPEPTAAHADALWAGSRKALRYRLVVPREAMRGTVGTRAGLQAGASLDFRDFRDYSPGDDLRHIDWNVFARTERLIVKRYREEVTPHLDILLDVSQSMDLTGTGKALDALYLAALLAGAGANAACTCKLWTAGAVCVPRPGTRQATILQPPAFESAVSPASGIAASAGALKRHGLRVLISDLLWEDDPMRVLWPLSERAASLYIIQVLARSERDPGQTGNLRLRDVESGLMRDMYVDTATLGRYRAALRTHQNVWRDACRRCGARFLSLSDAAPAENRIPEFLQRHGLIV